MFAYLISFMVKFKLLNISYHTSTYLFRIHQHSKYPKFQLPQKSALFPVQTALFNISAAIFIYFTQQCSNLRDLSTGSFCSTECTISFFSLVNFCSPGIVCQVLPVGGGWSAFPVVFHCPTLYYVDHLFIFPKSLSAPQGQRNGHIHPHVLRAWHDMCSVGVVMSELINNSSMGLVYPSTRLYTSTLIYIPNAWQ